MIEVKKYKKLNYVIRFPKGYEKEKQYPVRLFLHGAGTRGNDIEILRRNRFFIITEEHADFPFISIASQCSENSWFDLFETLQEFVKDIVSKPYVDKKRVYLMGSSMGGYGTWQLAMSMPEYFAAICPICGGGMYWNAARLANVPVWAFHGQKDPYVLLEESVKMVDAVNRCGGNARLTVYPEHTHDAWSDTYRNPKVFEWLLSCENQNTVELIEQYKGSNLYG